MRVSFSSLFSRRWPTATQEQLLRAALTQGRDAQSALERWRLACGYRRYDEIEFEATLLLPRVQRNLDRAGLSDPWQPQLTGLARLTWLHNAARQQRFVETLGHLQGSGVQPLVTGGFALLAGGYLDDAAVRPLLTAELTIASADAPRFHETLTALGWTTSAQARPKREVRRSETWRKAPDGNLCVNFHLLPRTYPDVGTAALWEHARAAELGGVRFRIPAATEMLLQLCVRGARRSRRQGARLVWIADAMQILERGAGRIDWDRLLRLSRSTCTQSPLRKALDYLAERFAAPIPAGFATALREAKNSPAERAPRRS